MLELEQVVKRYRNGPEEVRALDGISLEIAPGEMLALQGPSGSGKTTLLLLAAAALRADAGSVRFDGADLAAMSEQQAAQYRLAEVGLIAQNSHLMAHVTAVENAATKLLLGGIPLTRAREQALHWLERFHADGLRVDAVVVADQHPDGVRQHIRPVTAANPSPPTTGAKVSVEKVMIQKSRLNAVRIRPPFTITPTVGTSGCSSRPGVSDMSVRNRPAGDIQRATQSL